MSNLNFKKFRILILKTLTRLKNHLQSEEVSLFYVNFELIFKFCEVERKCSKAILKNTKAVITHTCSTQQVIKIRIPVVKQKNFNKKTLIQFFMMILNSFCFLAKILCFCFYRVNKKKKLAQMKQTTKHYTKSILDFFKHLVWILRAVNTFRERTIYRSIKIIKKFDLYLIDDLAHFAKINNLKNIHRNIFLKIPFFRRINRTLRKKMKKYLKYFGSFKSIKFSINFY